jgi:hypothetical protein
MSTAPSIPASPSRLLDRTAVGELVIALAVHTGYGADGAVSGTFNVNYGREDARWREWSSAEFPFTAEGERLALAKFNALVDAARTVQA